MKTEVTTGKFVEAFRVAAKVLWPYRFGQLLLVLLRKDHADPAAALCSIPDQDLFELLAAANTTVYSGETSNKAWGAFHLNGVRENPDALQAWSTDLLVFLPLADAFCEALRTAKNRSPSLRFGEILHDALVGNNANPASRLHYLYREDSIRLLHEWSIGKSAKKKVWP